MVKEIKSLEEIRDIPLNQLVLFNHRILGYNDKDFYDLGIIISGSNTDFEIDDYSIKLQSAINRVYQRNSFMDDIRRECFVRYPLITGWDEVTDFTNVITDLTHKLPQDKAIVAASLPLPEDLSVIDLARKFSQKVKLEYECMIPVRT